jgi:hypothetical protein
VLSRLQEHSSQRSSIFNLRNISAQCINEQSAILVEAMAKSWNIYLPFSAHLSFQMKTSNVSNVSPGGNIVKGENNI